MRSPPAQPRYTASLHSLAAQPHDSALHLPCAAALGRDTIPLLRFELLREQAFMCSLEEVQVCVGSVGEIRQRLAGRSSVVRRTIRVRRIQSI